MHAKPDLRVLLKWRIAGSGSVIPVVIPFSIYLTQRLRPLTMGKKKQTRSGAKSGAKKTSKRKASKKNTKRAADSEEGEQEHALAAPIEVSLADPHDVAMRTIAGFLGLQQEFTSPRHRLKKRFPRPFLATESTLKKLDEIATGELARLGGEGAKFEVEVSIPGAESETFSELEELFKSTNKLPRSLSLQWQVIQTEPISRNHIDVEFDTGASDSWLPVKEKPAGIYLSVGGREKDWCIVSKHKIEEQLDSTKVPALYRWLQIFENETVCFLGSYLVGIFLASVVWSASLSFTLAQSNQEFHDKQVERANELVSEYQDIQSDLEQKLKEVKAERDSIAQLSDSDEKVNRAIDLYYQSRVRDLESSISEAKESESDVEFPELESSALFGKFIRSLIPYFLGMVAIFAGHSLGQKLLPLLAPRSGIAIGNAVGKYADWENTFKFIIFTVLVCGMLIPLLRSFIW